MKELYFFDETFYWGRSGSEMVNKALHRRTDGSTYTITAHLKKVEWQNKKVEKRYGYV